MIPTSIYTKNFLIQKISARNIILLLFHISIENVVLIAIMVKFVEIAENLTFRWVFDVIKLFLENFISKKK